MRLRAPALILAILGCGLAAGAQAPVAFEAATIKRNLSNSAGMETLFMAGGFRAQNHPVRELIRYAYEVQSYRIVGGPDWIRAERFDVIGRAAGDVPRGALSAMLQTLLADRFKLRAHLEVREMPIYALVAARSDRRPGAQLTPGSAARCRPPGPGVPSWEAGKPPRCGALLSNPGVAMGYSVTLKQLADFLAETVDRSVVDRTGLSETFDLDLKWAPGLIDEKAPGLFTALQEQLGLRLESQRGPVEVLVVDDVEHPTPD
jgi:uncharacterized protein (TIGR03435 family)